MASGRAMALRLINTIARQVGNEKYRPQLDAALVMTRLHRVPVVIAKEDRLTRSVAFLSRRLEAGVDVRFADLPAIEGPAGSCYSRWRPSPNAKPD